MKSGKGRNGNYREMINREKKKQKLKEAMQNGEV